MSKSGFWSKINWLDAATVGLIALASLGIIAVQAGWHQTSGKMITGQGDVEYTILIRNLKTLQPKLFTPGEKLSITIRNQPRGEVAITQVKDTARKASFMSPGGSLKTMEDPADPYGHDYLVTLRDHALFSPEGYVVEGIKVKIGLAIEVEGFNYRVPGVIVDVHEANTSKASKQ